ncbi:MAG: tetratricopeptide repeat protein [Hyphomicrobiaceae bacterium]|nr:tetratricopeptide repeat protein [Hyphomicrobiaceae bacterium]
MVDRNDALLRELSDEMRADTYKKLWETYKLPIIAAIVAIPLGTFGWQIYDGQRRAAAEAAGARFESARRLLVENKTADADKAFAALSAEGPAGYAALARLHTAAALVKADKKAEAVVVFDDLGADTAVGSTISDFAKLQAASLRLGAADWTEMQNRLTHVMDEKSAYQNLAREIYGLAAIKAGKVEDARKAFLLVLGDAKSSQFQRERVQGHMTVILAADLAKSAAGSAPAVATDPAKK